MKNAEVESDHRNVFGKQGKLSEISDTLKIRNNQSGISKVFLVLAMVAGATAMLPFQDNNPLSGFLVAIISVVSLFAWYMPRYYRFRNERGDGVILIGKKFAYINGFFHNWNFPLSGIKKVKPVAEPFRGILFEYYYTDRTLRHTEKLIIPAPDRIDVSQIASELLRS